MGLDGNRYSCKSADVIFTKHTCYRIFNSKCASVEDVMLCVYSWSRLARRVATTVYTIMEEKRREKMR